MQREIHVPFKAEQDEDGVWAATAALTPDAFAHGQGPTREAAIEDLKEALALLAEEVGAPDQLVVTIQAD